MKKALISPNEPVYDFEGNRIGSRIADVMEKEFPVASPLFWVGCEDYVKADEYYWDDSEIKPVPVPPPPPEPTEP